jgi:hypothetical protein
MPSATSHSAFRTPFAKYADALAASRLSVALENVL